MWQIWNLGSPDPNFTLDAHQKGVNCVDYFTGGDKPYLITGSDDHTAKVSTILIFTHLSLDPNGKISLKHMKTGVGLSNQKLRSNA